MGTGVRSTGPLVALDPFAPGFRCLCCSEQLALFRMKAPLHSASLGLVTAILVAFSGLFHMPLKMASITAIYGACYGLFPIGWIILNIDFSVPNDV